MGGGEGGHFSTTVARLWRTCLCSVVSHSKHYWSTEIISNVLNRVSPAAGDLAAATAFFFGIVPMMFNLSSGLTIAQSQEVHLFSTWISKILRYLLVSEGNFPHEDYQDELPQFDSRAIERRSTNHSFHTEVIKEYVGVQSLCHGF